MEQKHRENMILNKDINIGNVEKDNAAKQESIMLQELTRLEMK